MFNISACVGFLTTNSEFEMLFVMCYLLFVMLFVYFLVGK